MSTIQNKTKKREAHLEEKRNHKGSPIEVLSFKSSSSRSNLRFEWYMNIFNGNKLLHTFGSVQNLLEELTLLYLSPVYRITTSFPLPPLSKVWIKDS